jgi:hypothetical protein
MKLGFNGIVLACAIFCSTPVLAQTPEPSKKSKPVVVKHEEPRPLESFPWHSLEVWVSMTTLLWPEAEWGIKSGPMDALYTPLTQSEINELIAYWRANKQPFLYVDDVWDCDDFALDMFFLSRVWSMKRTQGQSPMPAVGMAFVKITGCYELMRERHFIPGTAYHVIPRYQRDSPRRWPVVLLRAAKRQADAH